MNKRTRAGQRPRVTGRNDGRCARRSTGADRLCDLVNTQSTLSQGSGKAQSKRSHGPVMAQSWHSHGPVKAQSRHSQGAVMAQSRHSQGTVKALAKCTYRPAIAVVVTVTLLSHRLSQGSVKAQSCSSVTGSVMSLSHSLSQPGCLSRDPACYGPSSQRQSKSTLSVGQHSVNSQLTLLTQTTQSISSCLSSSQPPYDNWGHAARGRREKHGKW